RFIVETIELVTIIECMSADGGSIAPGFVTSTVEFPPGDCFDNLCGVGTSPNGWTNDCICKNWFEHTFIPKAMAQNQSGKLILL
ncbi:hypothetical protein M404DRAFT_75560, partial [Pisolithus tinctorius Marx 270]